MRIVFLAVDDEYAGAMQQPIYERLPKCVVGSVISSCVVYKKSMPGAALFLIRKSGLLYFSEMIRMKLVKKFFSHHDAMTPSVLAKQNNVEIFNSANINEEKSVEKLNAWQPDIIISTNFNHYIGKHVREAGTVGVWNLHKSYLPSYRGMAPNFFALLDGAATAGVTLHKVAKGFDTGDIITQMKVPIHNHDTVYSLNMRTAEEGGKMMADFLEKEDLHNITYTPQPEGEWPNYTYPSRQDIREFRNKGLRFY